LAEARARDATRLAAKPASERDKLDAAQKATSIALEDAAMAKEAMGQELALMQNQLSAVQAAQAASEAEVHELRAALTAEKDRAFRAEVEVSELQGKLQMMDELEKELLKYKDMLVDKDKKGSGGLWGYIAGA
jgi:chromosome segregation ATPase